MTMVNVLSQLMLLGMPHNVRIAVQYARRSPDSDLFNNTFYSLTGGVINSHSALRYLKAVAELLLYPPG